MSNFNVTEYWEKNKTLIVADERMQRFAMEKIGLIKGVSIDYGKKTTKSYSEISTFSTCRRKWNLEYNLLYTKKITKHYFYFGGLLHDCMEYLYTLKFYDINFNLKDIINFFVFLSNFNIEKLKVDYPEKRIDIAELEFETSKGFAIITEYMNSILPLDLFKMCKRPDSEKPFLETIFANPVETPAGNISNKYIHTGKIDGLVEIDGSYFLLEHKFLASFNSADEEWLGKDLQILSYVYAIQKKFNIKISGVFYNVCKKPMLRQKKTESIKEFQDRIIKDFAERPSFYFNRYTVYINQENIKEVPFFIYDNCKEMATSRCLPASSFICKRTGCQFKEVCLSDNPETVLENNFRIKTKKHEEL